MWCTGWSCCGRLCEQGGDLSRYMWRRQRVLADPSTGRSATRDSERSCSSENKQRRGPMGLGGTRQVVGIRAASAVVLVAL